MNLLFDLVASQPKKGEQFHGAGFYASLIFRYLAKDLKGHQLIGFYFRDRPLHPDVMALSGAEGIILEAIDSIEEVYGLIQKHEVTRVFSAIPSNLRSLRLKNVHFVFTNHGLRGIEKHWDSTELKYTSSLKGKLKVLAKALFSKKIIHRKITRYQGLHDIAANYSIVTVSHHSKASIFLNLGLKDPDQIKVFYSPLFLDEQIPIDLPSEVEGPYFLIVSGNRWIKNSFRAIQAFKNLQKHYPHDIKLVITGISRNNPLKKWSSDNVIMMDYVEEDVLQSLYQHCYAFVYPTLNEGFGYPPLEAQRFGKPVLSASNTSLFEVLADSAHFFDTTSIMEIETRMFQVLSDKDLYNRLSKKGHANYKRVLSLQNQDLISMKEFLFS
ncbi:glycosyltransferase [Oceanispirochaeta crateris]|uniref:Glycosyltransferase n=1 Tax=Oceanispirochaeta crateris TaxID=2518645 RepID=A0A5C1QHK9_9SPIO|nr:glycosyltransferase [Oceanispirochaeta crateris]QEN06997.1 glycosyltransferase [Oceanispirochaeta crateris]